MEVVQGQVLGADPKGITIFVPYTNWERFALRQYETVEVGLHDGRTITPEQRRKCYALLGEIAAWAGMDTEEVKLTTKHDFIKRHLEGLKKELFSLSDCDVTTAREYISYLIDFVIDFGVPCKKPLYELCDDIARYMYACCTHKVCAVCGIKADLHHVDRVGMGRDRTDMVHIGLECLPLCRNHHMEAHQHGDNMLMERYHLQPIAIDEKIAKIYKLGGKANNVDV